MSCPEQSPAPGLPRLFLAWGGLVALTLAGLGLGRQFHAAAWLQAAVAAVVWIKGLLVARAFLDLSDLHPFLRRVLLVFIAFAPLALVLLDLFGPAFARWATL